MVAVALKNLVLVPDTRPLWPEEFRLLVQAAEEATLAPLPDPADGQEDEDVYQDRMPFGPLADWCREHNEHELAAAWHWLYRRPEVPISVHRPREPRASTWTLAVLPRSLGWGTISSPHATGLCGLVAALADRLAELRRELE